MPDHATDYATWQGKIPAGQYGAGKVNVVRKYKGVLNTDSKGRQYLAVQTPGGIRKFMLNPPKNGQTWFAVSRSLPKERHWEEREQYRNWQGSLKDAKGWIASEKHDGALVYTKFTPKGITLTSRRKSTSGKPIAKEHHVPWIRDIVVPQKYQKIIAAGELVHPKGFSYATPLQNMLAMKAVDKQQELGRMQLILHGIMNQDLTGEERANLVSELTDAINSEYVHAPEYSRDPLELYRKVVEKGGEGIVLMDPESVPPTLYKKKHLKSYTGRVVGYELGTGKNTDRVGALIVEDSNGNRVRVGGGKGFTQDFRKQLLDKWPDFQGRKIRVEAKGSSGFSLRDPRFAGWDLEERPLDSFESPDVLYGQMVSRMRT